jgi:hypothetical protein
MSEDKARTGKGERARVSDPGQVGTEYDNTVKFKEGWKMNVATKVKKVKMVISESLATHRAVKIVGMLAAGAVLIAGTAIQFAPGPEDEPVSNPSVGKVEAVPTSNDTDILSTFRMDESSGATHRLREELRAADREEDFQEMVRYWNRLKRDAEAAAPATSPAGSVASEYRFMDLEDEPLSVEFLRTYVYPEERPSSSETPAAFQQEIERLEGEISALLAEARQDPSTDPLELDRDLRNLHYQLDMLRLAAMEQQ